MNKKSALATFWCLLLLATPGSGQSQPRRYLKIGYIADLTGIGAFFSVQAQRGITLAKEHVSGSDLLHGAQLDVVVEDIAGKVPNAVSAAMKLIDQDHVDALICDLTGPCSAIAKKVANSNVVLIYHSPASSISATHKQSFRNFLDYDAACQKMAQYWKVQGHKVIGSLNANLEFGQRCYEGVERVFSQHYSYRNNPGDDLRTAPLEFKKRLIEQVIFTGYENDFLSWLKFSAAQNVPIESGFIDLLATESLWNHLGKIPLKGITAGFDFVPSEFQERVRGRFHITEDAGAPATALGYNAVRSLAEAFSNCASGDLRCMTDQLHKSRSGYLLGFRGWGGDGPEYPVILKRVNGRQLERLPFDEKLDNNKTERTAGGRSL
jgi:ABC-type branched-subunit amino acid transport system substrate-binding protein